MQSQEIFAKERLRFSKPLYLLGIASVFFIVALLPLWVIDPRTVGGVSTWEKPIKFFVSAALFSFTYSWLSSFLTKRQRLIKTAGYVIAIALTVELALITAVAALAETSHFNVSSPAAITIWSLMAAFISLVLLATLLLSIAVFLDQNQGVLLRVGLGMGSLNTSIGMALAFLMTSPTSNQLADFQGVAGSHSVGIADGGPGLPLLGWSTIAGDLRVGHFFGLHSIQVALILLMISTVLPSAARLPVITVGNVSYLGFVFLVTLQALNAEPFASPSQATLISLAMLAGTASAVAILWSLANFWSGKTSDSPA